VVLELYRDERLKIFILMLLMFFNGIMRADKFAVVLGMYHEESIFFEDTEHTGRWQEDIQYGSVTVWGVR